MVNCEHRSRLLEEMRAALRRVAELRAEQLEAWRRHESGEDTSAERIRTAVEIAEGARIAFERHTQVHRCSQDCSPAAN